MITEDYISLEVAKLLKDKGFDQNCATYYPDEHVWYNYLDKYICRHYPSEIIPKDKQIYAAPTQAMAMKWLREEHHIHIEIYLYKTNGNYIEQKKNRKDPYYTFGVLDTITGDNIDKRLINDFIGDTYKQACEAAIKYCLKNLI